MDEGTRQLVQCVRQRRDAASVDADRRLHCCLPGNPSLQRWQRQAVAFPDDTATAACRVRVRSLQFDGKYYQGKQGQLLPGVAAYPADHPQRKAELGILARVFPQDDGQAEEQPCCQGERRTSPALVLAGAVTPDTGTR